MNVQPSDPQVSVIIPARNEASSLGDCLRSLVGQTGGGYEIIVVDDQSTDSTHAIAEGFPIRVIRADPLPPGWSGKCNAVWSGAKLAKGKWLLFTDADTTHAPDSIATGLEEAIDCGAAMLSYSPRQEVHGLAERALMPVVFAELAATYRPQDVSDPHSPAAAANGQYLLIRREVYDAVGGHAAVAGAILEDVALAKLIKRSGYRLRFRTATTVSARMYRNFPQMWEGWTKNLALLFPHALRLAAVRSLEFVLIAGSAAMALVQWSRGEPMSALIAGGLLITFASIFLQRIRRAHFDALSSALAVLGLPLFTVLLLNSHISHRRGVVRWKGREYRGGEFSTEQPAAPESPAPSYRES